MLQPPKFPANHPSVIELEENDNVVEKYEEKIKSVCSILTDDQLKQKAFLRQKLVAIGKLMDPSLLVRSETTSTTVSSYVVME